MVKSLGYAAAYSLSLPSWEHPLKDKRTPQGTEEAYIYTMETISHVLHIYCPFHLLIL